MLRVHFIFQALEPEAEEIIPGIVSGHMMSWIASGRAAPLDSHFGSARNRKKAAPSGL
jgi:hypothetical protein